MENKRPYINYAAKPQAQAAKQTPKPETVESVAANAVGVAPQEKFDTEKEVAAPAVDKIERVTDVDQVTVKIVDTDLLNVRSTPDTYSRNVIGQLTKGTKVNVIREIGEFSQIGDNKFVMTKFLV